MLTAAGGAAAFKAAGLLTAGRTRSGSSSSQLAIAKHASASSLLPTSGSGAASIRGQRRPHKRCSAAAFRLLPPTSAAMAVSSTSCCKPGSAAVCGCELTRRPASCLLPLCRAAWTAAMVTVSVALVLLASPAATVQRNRRNTRLTSPPNGRIALPGLSPFALPRHVAHPCQDSIAAAASLRRTCTCDAAATVSANTGDVFCTWHRSSRVRSCCALLNALSAATLGVLLSLRALSIACRERSLAQVSAACGQVIGMPVILPSGVSFHLDNATRLLASCRSPSSKRAKAR
mmetsp:Transcript_23180/g.58453  ORF Transcript_23180/g.58453 Transcript_23180/m.58453 type:complete len:289 (+) Transcript_23180:416-1282(+)